MEISILLAYRLVILFIIVTAVLLGAFLLGWYARGQHNSTPAPRWLHKKALLSAREKGRKIIRTMDWPGRIRRINEKYLIKGGDY